MKDVDVSKYLCISVSNDAYNTTRSHQTTPCVPSTKLEYQGWEEGY